LSSEKKCVVVEQGEASIANHVAWQSSLVLDVVNPVMTRDALALCCLCARFYAGAPLVYTDDNLVEWKLGTLCIIAPTPRTMADDEVVLLEMLARLVVAELELRMKLRKSVMEFKSEADKQALLRAVELNAAYIGQVAHDLRTPLNSFSLGLEFLMGHSNMTPDQLSVVETMKISAELMDMTCTKAVDHTNFEMGVTMAAKKAPFNLKDLLKKSQIVIAGYTHESKGVKYEFHIEKGVAPKAQTLNPKPSYHPHFATTRALLSRSPGVIIAHGA
jgi:K+-sensing histidine kinase KdpD